jgi:hypothetical protein
MSLCGTPERNGPHCREDAALTPEKKERLRRSLRESGLSEDIFGFHEALARLSTEEVRWIFVKAFARNELLGLGIFAKVQGLNASQLLRSELRARPWLQRVGMLLRTRMYFSVHNLCSSLSSPFLCKDDSRRAIVVGWILSWLKQSGHDVIIVDSNRHSDLYRKNGFGAFPFASNSWLDVTSYAAIGDYLFLPAINCTSSRATHERSGRTPSTAGQAGATDGALAAARE